MALNRPSQKTETQSANGAVERTMGQDILKAILTAGCLGAGLLALHPGAYACGGTFCGQPPPEPTPPAPVDQTAERIVFLVEDGMVTAHVQIQYTGSADAFAWVVPVPEVPVVEESSEAVFMELDLPTAPQVVLPASEPCPQNNNSGGGGVGFGCSGSADLALIPGENNEPGPMNPDVTRYGNGVTDNYEYDIVGARNTEALVTWLGDNGYNVSDNMVPVMKPYEGDDHKFLAVKLRDGRQASDIVPISMRFAADKPMIPIQLTRVAAQPFMGISVFIVGDSPFYPENYKHLRPRATELLINAQGQVNYFDWVARTVDENEGHLFVTEYIGPAPSESRFAGKTVSRFYTRMNPGHMTLDPMFEARPGTTGRSNIIDLTSQPAFLSCGNPIPDRLPSACAFNYCGADSTCALANGQVSCICPEGQASQAVSSPDGLPRVACVPVENPFGVVMPEQMAGTIADPCFQTDCGKGTCIARSGFAVCQCAADSVATMTSNGNVVCIGAPSDLPTFGPGAGEESRPTVTAAMFVRDRQTGMATFWAVLVAMWALRTRRKR